MKFLSLHLGANLIAAAAGLLLGCSAALAQAAPPPASAPARPPGAPEVKLIGDWTVRCFPAASPSPCDMYQELDDKNMRQRVLSFSIAFVPGLDRNGIQITVPLEVSLSAGLVIQTDSFTSPVLHYRRCDRQGCYVEMAMDAGSVSSLAKSGPDAKIKIVADGGKAFDLRFSLNGFSSAHDTMVELARQKAKSVSKPGEAPAPTAPAPTP
jgi:invasion protein IalB